MHREQSSDSGQLRAPHCWLIGYTTLNTLRHRHWIRNKIVHIKIHVFLFLCRNNFLYPIISIYYDSLVLEKQKQTEWTFCSCAYKCMSLKMNQRNGTCFINPEALLVQISPRNQMIPAIPKSFCNIFIFTSESQLSQKSFWLCLKGLKTETPASAGSECSEFRIN